MLATEALFSSYHEGANPHYCSIFLGMTMLIHLKLLQFFVLRSLSIETQLLDLSKAVLVHPDQYK